MRGTNRCAQEQRLCADLIVRSTSQSRAPEVWLEWPVFAVTMDRYVGSGQACVKRENSRQVSLERQFPTWRPAGC